MNRLLAILCLCVPIEAATYYINSSASEGGDGSIGTPYDDLNDIVSARDLEPGDRILVTGTFTERLQTGSNDDGASGNPIKWIAANTVTINGGIYVTGSDYNEFHGDFRPTHFNNVGSFNYALVLVENCTGTRFYNGNFSYCDAENIRILSSTDTLFRNCYVSYSGYDTYPWDSVSGSCIVEMRLSTNTRFEWCQFAYTDDYMNFNSTASSDFVLSGCVLGPNIDSIAHNDVLQDNSTVSDVLVENCYDFENDIGLIDESAGHHWTLVGSGTGGPGRRIIFRGCVNVSYSGTVIISGTDEVYHYHNTCKDNYDYVGSNSSMVLLQSGSHLNMIRNSSFTRSTAPSTGLISISGSTASTTHNHGNGNGAALPGSDNQTADPNFVDGTGPVYDLRPNSGSPLENNAGAITTVNGSGTSATIPVNGFATAFWPGDTITVGADTVTVSSITDTNTIVLTGSITYANGESVLWRGQNDIGAYPVETIFLTAATHNGAGTVTPTGNASRVDQVRAGELIATDTASPFNGFSHQSGDVYYVYAAYAQEDPIVQATPSASSVATTVGSGASLRSGVTVQ